MKWKKNDISLFQSAVVNHSALRKLDKIEQLIDWSKIEKVLSKINYQKTSLAYNPLLLFKCLLLQIWYNLSDQELENSLARDLLFKKFTGLDINAKVPDYSTIWRYRERLKQAKIIEGLLEAVTKQLTKKNIKVKQGIGIVDASVVEASRSRIKKGKKGNNTQDAEGGYQTKKDSKGRLKTTYGYKVHVKCDGRGIAKKMEFTKASVHDSKVFEELVGDETEIYADKAYSSRKHEDFLRKRGIKSRIQKKGYRNRVLSVEERENNKVYGRTRVIVERVFGIWKLHYGARKCRYVGLARNRLRYFVMAIGYNLKVASRLAGGV